jgi:hypothetical protein
MELLLMRDTVKIALRQQLQAKLLFNDRLCVVCAMTGTILAIIAVSNHISLRLSQSEQYFWSDPNSGKDWNDSNTIITLLRIVVTLTTIATVALIVRHYRIIMQYLKAREVARPTGMKRSLHSDYRNPSEHRIAILDDP